MLLCKQIRCRWHLVYIISFQIMRRRLAALQERESNVQDCFHLVRALQHPVRPPVRGDRPPAAGLRGDDDPQRRHPPLQRLISRGRTARACGSNDFEMAPVCGAIFFKSVARRDVSTRAINRARSLPRERSTSCCILQKAAGFARFLAWRRMTMQCAASTACDKLTLPATK